MMQRTQYAADLYVHTARTRPTSDSNAPNHHYLTQTAMLGRRFALMACLLAAVAALLAVEAFVPAAPLPLSSGVRSTRREVVVVRASHWLLVYVICARLVCVLVIMGRGSGAGSNDRRAVGLSS